MYAIHTKKYIQVFVHHLLIGEAPAAANAPKVDGENGKAGFKLLSEGVDGVVGV